MKRRLYAVNPPAHMQDTLLTSPAFAVFDDAAGVKVAAHLEHAGPREKTALFEHAVKIGTSDLGDAYADLKRENEKALAEDEDEAIEDLPEGPPPDFVVLEDDSDELEENG